MTVMTKISISAETLIYTVSLHSVLLCLPINGPIKGSSLYGQAPSLEIKNFNKNKTRQNKTRHKPQNGTLDLVLHVTTEAYLGNHLSLSPSLPNFKMRNIIGQLESFFHPLILQAIELVYPCFPNTNTLLHRFHAMLNACSS